MFRNIVSLIEKVDDAAAEYADASHAQTSDAVVPSSASHPQQLVGAVELGGDVHGGQEVPYASSSSQHAVVIVGPSPTRPSPFVVSAPHNQDGDNEGDHSLVSQVVPVVSTSSPPVNDVVYSEISAISAVTDENALLRRIAELQCDLSCRHRDLSVALAQIAALHSACDRRDEVLRRIIDAAQPVVESWSTFAATNSGSGQRFPSLLALRDLLCEAEATATSSHGATLSMSSSNGANEQWPRSSMAHGSPGPTASSRGGPHSSTTSSWELAAQMLQGNVEELREANIALRVQVATAERTQHAADTVFREQIDALRQQLAEMSEHAAEHQRRKAEVVQVTKQVSVLQAALRDAALRESAAQEQQRALERILLLRDEEIAALHSRLPEPELKPIASTHIYHAVGKTRYGPAFQRAATVLDLVSFRVGRVLRGHVWIRVFVVIYLLILHLYTFHVVSVFAHDMPHVGEDVHDHLKNHMR